MKALQKEDEKCRGSEWNAISVRYFKDIVKAQRYFEKCRSKHLEVELWQVSYLYCPLLERFSARQDLLTFSGARYPIH